MRYRRSVVHAPIVNTSDQWREHLQMIQEINQSAVKNLVYQVKTSFAGNPGYKSVYINNEESFHLKTLRGLDDNWRSYLSV